MPQNTHGLQNSGKNGVLHRETENTEIYSSQRGAVKESHREKNPVRSKRHKNVIKNLNIVRCIV